MATKKVVTGGSHSLTPERNVHKKQNENLVEDLKANLDGIAFREDLATLSHYLSLQGTAAAENYRKNLAASGVNLKNLPARKDCLKKYARFPPPSKRKFTFIDLFAGIGGFRLAMQRNGGECVFSSEWDESAKKTYAENYGEWPFGDINQINPKEIPDFDILTGGFPCQPFSSIGKREGFGHKTQGTLFFSIANILHEKRPKAFLLENVPGLMTHDGGKTLAVILDTLERELHYTVFSKILNSADYGVPQERKRLYFVGFQNELNVKNFEFPTANGKRVGIGTFIEKDAKGPSISEYLQKAYLFKKNDGRPEIVDENSDFPVKTLCASYHKIQRLTGTFVRGGETGLRLFTENECKAIMGFPKNFKIPVSRTQMYHQFGNSVAEPVVEKIAKEMVACLEKKHA